MTVHNKYTNVSSQLTGEEKGRSRRLAEGGGKMWMGTLLRAIWGNGPHNELLRREVA